jgi:hypothetical protein
VTPLLRVSFLSRLDEGTYLTSIMIRLLFYRATALEGLYHFTWSTAAMTFVYMQYVMFFCSFILF